MGENPPRYSRRKEARPGELVDAARLEFAEHGYGDAKLARIAKRAGVSNGTLYHYFSDKAELFEAVFQAAFVDPIAQDGLAALDRPDGDPLLMALDQLFEEEVVALLSILMFEAQRYPDPVGTIAKNVLQNVEAALSRYLTSGGLAEEKVPTNPLTLISHGLGLALFEKARGRPDWAETARAAVREHLAQLKG